MTEAREPGSVVAEAEHAAASGDYVSAERLLTEGALLQEARLGALHPDLANTLNNLGIVCEILQKPLDAERYFRRAFAIATTSLAPDHPFVATSRKNLEDFCRSRDIAFEPPAPVAVAEPEAPTLESAPPAMASVVAPVEQPSYDEPRPVATQKSPRAVVIGSLIVVALLVVLVARVLRHDEPAPVDAASATASDKAVPVDTAPEAAVAAPTPPPPQPITPPAAPPAEPKKSRATNVATSRPPTVAAAELCGELATRGEWQCVAPGNPAAPGVIYFYSRLKSATDTTVQHRWYHGDRLRQAVDLRVRANTTGGFRTYSRQTVDSGGTPDWRVELRTSDGVVLHEERFVVR